MYSDNNNQTTAYRTKRKVKRANFVSFILAFGLAFCFCALATLVVIGAIASGVNNNLRSSTKLIAPDTIEYGQTSVINLEQPHLNKYDEISWYIDDVLVDENNSTQLTLTATESGTHTVKTVISGKVPREYTHEFYVKKPKLTIKFNDCEHTYGEVPINAAYTIEGLFDGDTAEVLGLEVNYDETLQSKTGDAEIKGIARIRSDKYDIEYKSGQMKIKPRKLKIKNQPIIKEYDGTTFIDTTLLFEGAIGNDNPVANYNMYLSCKDVGECNIIIENLKLDDKHCNKYIVEHTLIPVQITPKQVFVSDIVANDKMFDGNNSVTFSQVGVLNGVAAGDAVAIGLISGHFDTARVGADKLVYIDDIQLVGKDADNYVIIGGITTTAEIKSNGIPYKSMEDIILASPKLNKEIKPKG